MALPPTLIAHIYEAGLGIPGVRPQVSATLFALAGVEASFGTTAAMEAALAAYASIVATLGGVDPIAIDAGITLLGHTADKLREARAALADGRAPKGAVVRMNDTPGVSGDAA